MIITSSGLFPSADHGTRPLARGGRSPDEGVWL